MEKIIEILKNPEIPEELIKAISKNKLVVFIGAGVSRIVGCKGWQDLARDLVKLCFETRNLNNKTLINFKEKEILDGYNDSKKVISMCYYILKNNGKEEEFYKKLEDSLLVGKEEEALLNSAIYDYIFDLKGIFITTNADKLLHNKFETERIIYENINLNELSQQKLFHIHGMIDKRESLVFTVDQYLKSYNKESFKNFLTNLFEEYTILFIGYGVNEFELLDYIVTKNFNGALPQMKHYMLHPMYKDEINILKFEQAYYNKFGIKLIPYQKDELGYNQLTEVLKNWNNQIRSRSTYLAHGFDVIDKCIQTLSSDSLIELKQYIRDQSHRDYFYNLILTKNIFEKKLINFILEEIKLEEQNIPSYKNQDNFIDYWKELIIYKKLIINNLLKIPEKRKQIIRDTLSKLSKYIYSEKIQNHRTNEIILELIIFLCENKLKENEVLFLNYVLLESHFNGYLFHMYLEENLLPKIIKERNKELLEQILKVVLKGKKGKFTVSSVLNDYYFKEVFEKNIIEIIKLLDIKFPKIICSIIKKNIKELNQTFSIWAIPNLEEIVDDYNQDYEKIIIELLVWSLKKIQFYKKDNQEFIKECFKSDIEIFQRISLYIMTLNFDIFREFLFLNLQNIFSKKLIKLEIYRFLEFNCQKFTTEEIKEILKHIEVEYFNNNKEEEAFAKKEILTALKNSDNKEVKRKYNYYSQIIPQDIIFPKDYIGKVEVGFVENRSPKSKKEILQMMDNDINELKYLLEEYKDKENKFDSKIPNKEGLANELKEAVIENKEIFEKNIIEFLKINEYFIYSLLDGLKEVINKEKNVSNLKGILDFLFKLIKMSKVWAKEDMLKVKNKISELLNTLIISLDEKISKQDLQKIFMILEIGVKNLDIDKYEGDDILLYGLNSTNAKYYDAMVNLLICSFKIYKESKKSKIFEKIENILENKLNRDSNVNYILGKNITRLYVLNKIWLLKNLDTIFDVSKGIYFWQSIGSYLSYNNRIYPEIYTMMKVKYDEAIINLDSSTEKKIKEKLIPHIMVAYFNFSDYKNQLDMLIEKKDLKIYLEILNFVNNNKEVSEENCLEIWKKIYKIDLSEDEKNKVYPMAMRLLSKIENLSLEVMEMVKGSIKYFNQNNIYGILKIIDKFVSNYPNNVAEIILEFAKNKIFFNYNLEEGLIKIIEEIYEKGNKKDADIICNKYLEENQLFLREIFNKNQAVN